jgi:hypothetical protein
MTEDIDLKKRKKENLLCRDFMCVCEESTSLILSNQVRIFDESVWCRILTLSFLSKCDLRAHFILVLIKDFEFKL